MNEKSDCHPNQEVQLLRIPPTESHYQVYPQSSKSKELCQKSC